MSITAEDFRPRTLMTKEVQQSSGSLREMMLEAARKELSSLMEETGALIPLTQAEVDEEMKAGGQMLYPKLVWSLKETQGVSNQPVTVGKLRCTVDGSRQKMSSTTPEQNSTSNVDATTLRTALSEATFRGFHWGQLDVKTAFLLASLRESKSLLMMAPRVSPIIKSTPCPMVVFNKITTGFP